MVRSMTAAVSGLRAHQTKLDVIGNNIANVNTYGYKASRVVFRDSMYQTVNGASSSNANYAGTNANQVGYGTKVGTIGSVWSTGAYYPTDWGVDTMIMGDGYFIVGPEGLENQPLDDLSGAYLTRVGEFDVVDGYLVDMNGNYVYGFDPTQNPPTLDRIQMPTTGTDANGDPIYMSISNIQIGKDGTVTYNDDKGDSKELDVQVAVAYVQNAKGLEAVSNSYFTIGVNAGDAYATIAGTNSTGEIQNGGLEMSTVDLAKEFTDMITTQRGFQANSRIITVTDEMLQELVNLKR